MIFGVGTDIVDIRRMQAFWQRQGDRVLNRLLAPEERAACRDQRDPARFLAKRFAAKEALGKALGTGIRAPVLLTAIQIEHDALGKPAFAYSHALTEWLRQRHLVCHVSISDETHHVLAFVVVEQP